MAFNSNSSSAQSNNTDWKANRFLNVYIKHADGTRRKLGAIPLKTSKAFEKAVIARLDTGEDALAAMVDVLEYDYHNADVETPVSAVGF
jgi:hypothetical protein